MKFISVIPARSGSKGLKNKNIFKINNKPLVNYTFNAAKSSLIKDHFVLTDSSKVKKLAKKYSINTDYFRPKKLSTDKTSLPETLHDFYNWTLKKKIKFDYLVVLQPTSPLRNFNDINKSLTLIRKTKNLSLFSISSSLEHPYETIKLFKKKIYHVLKKSKNFYRRQDFDFKSYFINGAIYIIHKSLIIKKKMHNLKKHSLYEMPKTRSLEINDRDEAMIIESLIKNRKYI
tara:strand:- start:930 stop:1622 length:693 start_codon:yes stop_codon:yes gene_type:complete